MPSSWEYLLHTNLALFLDTLPSSVNLFQNTHLVPITFLFLGLGIRVHVLFFSICSISSFIASIQLSFVNASLMLLGSKSASKQVFFSLLLVKVPLDLSPMIWYGAWCLLTYLANIGSLPLEWVSLLSPCASISYSGYSGSVRIGSSASDSVDTCSIVSECCCGSVWTFCILVTDDSGVKDSWVNDMLGIVSGSM